MDLTRGTYVELTQQPDLAGSGARAKRRASTYQAFVPAPISDVELAI